MLYILYRSRDIPSLEPSSEEPDVHDIECTYVLVREWNENIAFYRGKILGIRGRSLSERDIENCILSLDIITLQLFGELLEPNSTIKVQVSEDVKLGDGGVTDPVPVATSAMFFNSTRGM